VEDGLRRAHSEAQDRIGLETIDFHSRVLEGYKRQAMAEPQRIKTIDAAQPIETVVNEAWSLVEPRLISQGHSLR
jgi:dTMP kinase